MSSMAIALLREVNAIPKISSRIPTQVFHYSTNGGKINNVLVLYT